MMLEPAKQILTAIINHNELYLLRFIYYTSKQHIHANSEYKNNKIMSSMD